MNRIILFTLVLILSVFSAAAHAGNEKLKFSWDQENLDRVNFWRLCWSKTQGGPYTTGCIDIHKDDLQDKKYTATISYPNNRLTRYYFVLVALKDDTHFSRNSNEVSHAVDLRQVSVPLNLTVEIIPTD